MGTSKRNINNKIKEILQGTSKEKLNEKAVEISESIITEKSLKETIYNEQSFYVSLDTINSNFKSLNSEGYKGKSKKDLEEDPLTRDEFIDKILIEIENETKIDSDLLKKSLKIVMIKFMNEEFDIYAFAQLLFYQITYELLFKELNDTLVESISNVSYEEIKEMAEYNTTKLMDAETYNLINNLVDRKISLDSVITTIVKKTENAKFGDF
ncbi:hypothetical protein HXZ66_15785 [Bacillus sp. A116_S68]|jgi:hypothetical protein|nr:hypothetical protein HXZ66_15785 [Bacillus sp. A116_S68]